MRYSTEPRDWIYIKDYRFLSFAKNTGNNYCQKRLYSAKKCTTDATKTTLKRTIQKTAKETGDLIGNKIADKITSVSKKSSTRSEELHLQNNEANGELETTKERYIPPKKDNKSLMI